MNNNNKEIKDSGQKREFTTGSHRDFKKATEVGDCTLLPETSVILVLDLESTAKAHTIQEHLKEAVRDIMFYKQNTANKEYLARAAYEALVAVGLDEGAAFQNANLEDNFACLSLGLMRTSIHYAAGAEKYGRNNWKLGQPISVLLDSGLRHCFKGISGNDDEPHIRAAAWNFLCAVWTVEHLPEMQDLPVSGNEKPL
jgi:hypothetical protein